ncbi:collagen alpha-5(VI) chain-like isoform X2 [Halichondria panicea]|uniref:collagen alpha-5(VI) chain-like isoform X2 n=1 Tax=Halichondria panicea TaxID=6063 RepID=UPI00312B548D
MAASLTGAVLILSIMLQLSAAQQRVDRTLQNGASGSDVVRAVTNKVQAVFGDDQQFLRRIAFVESKDGTDSSTYRSGYNGGIWQVDDIAFRATQDTSSHPRLILQHEKIKAEFEIDWQSVQWSDLRAPLYSGLAARLFLLTIPEAIPCNVAEQAAYWKKYYNTASGAGTKQKFIDDINSLTTSSDEVCQVNSDIIFVLDESGSIGDLNFELVKGYVLQYLSSLKIGPNENQVGVITFSDNAMLRFKLNANGNTLSLQRAIQGLRYRGGSTNIPAALCALSQAFLSNSSGARSDNTIFRVAILMTDGKSSTNNSPNPCGFTSVADAAAAIHGSASPITTFAFGVGSSFSYNDLQVIASGDQYIGIASSFTGGQLSCVQTNQEDRICNKISRKVTANAVNSGTLDQGGQARWEYPVPQSGLDFKIDVTLGRVVFYASSDTTAPNEAIYQWKIEVSFGSRTINILPVLQSDGVTRSSTANQTIIPIYTAIVGLEAKNVFSISNGDLQEENVAVKIAVPATVGIVLILVVAGISIGLYSHYRRKPVFV